MPSPIAPSLFPAPRPLEIDLNQVLNTIYIDAMVRYGGDQAQARAFVEQMRPTITRAHQMLPDLRSGDAATSGRAVQEMDRLLRGAGYSQEDVYAFLRGQLVPDAALRRGGLNPEAVNPDKTIEALIPAITGSDRAAATAALRQGIQILIQHRGLKGPEPLYSWLSKNVSDEEVLRGAGIDPEAVKRATKPADPHPDIAALLEISRQMLAMISRNNGDPGGSTADLAALGETFRRFTDSNNGTAVTGLTATGTTVRNLIGLPIRV